MINTHRGSGARESVKDEAGDSLRLSWKRSVSSDTYMNVFVGLYESQRASQSYLYKPQSSSLKWTTG